MIRHNYYVVIAIFLTLPLWSNAQDESSPSLEDMMKGYEWVGHSPSNPFWSVDGKKIYFQWNKEPHADDSLYQWTIHDKSISKVPLASQWNLPDGNDINDQSESQQLFEKNGDIFLINNRNSEITQLTRSPERESNPKFLSGANRIVYELNSNLFIWELKNDQLIQITNFQMGDGPGDKGQEQSEELAWLARDQINNFRILQERKAKQDLSQEIRKYSRLQYPTPYYTKQQRISHIQLSPDEKYVTFRLTDPAVHKSTMVPEFVTESGFTGTLSARPKVGDPQDKMALHIYDRQLDSVYQVDITSIPGIGDHPTFIKNYLKKYDKIKKYRDVVISNPIWSDHAIYAIVVIKSMDNKDRWIMRLNPAKGTLSLLDRQTDPAWIGGPGISGWNWSNGSVGFMPDNQSIWFQSEETGYAHLYKVNLTNGKKTALTKGKYEVYDPYISNDKKYFYYTSNQADSGQRHFYKMPIDGGSPIRLTQMTGRNDVVLSPDEKSMAIIHSFANQPPELYFCENKPGATPERITFSQSAAFIKCKWAIPSFITFEAEDGTMVPARLYRAEDENKNNAAVVFVHGAGYLQNAHKWWSSYYREYMFHNYLVAHGYTVLDIDYRGSAGYGRDWRTAIYQHMGGKDLDDQVDGARYLVNELGIDPGKIGIYGGSYGGFITLMAMFTKPGVFKAGAALRSVTDWAHYNHDYTSNILNTPATDSIAYIKSSPIYYADGLQDALLICHGMVDTNVQFQDVVRLVQRLIELKKENWELAVYPMENHGFVEASSWYDEYRRIFELFENNLK